jgi:5-formyltetrahydrofolate cyclo-ligase
MTKAQLRREISEKRRLLDGRWLANTSLRIVEQIQHLDAFKSAERIALYKALAGEVDLERLFAACWKLGKHTAIPIFNRTLKTYEWAEITAGTQFVTGHYGIQEPEHPSPAVIDTMDLIILPGVAFDTNGNRLGRGGGYYDRMLDGFSGATAAAAFEFQLFADIPHESHDRPVNCIVTESKVIDVCNER